MKTYFLSDHVVEAYLADLMSRLSPAPAIWCPVTESGNELAQQLFRLVPPELAETTRVIPIDVECAPGGAVRLIESREAPAAFLGSTVLLLDGAIHSGRVMSACVDYVLTSGAAEVTSYSLVVKRSSSFIPSIWGLMTDETDRTYFLLDQIPNNRLHAGQHGRPQPPVHLRRLEKAHTLRPTLESGLSSIDRMNWDDRLYQMETSRGGTCTYVLERGTAIVGFLTVISEPGQLTIAEIVGKGYGAILMRFADTLARQADCSTVSLNAIEARIPWYKDHGYTVSSGQSLLELGEERYQPMERRVLYHQRERV